MIERNSNGQFVKGYTYVMSEEHKRKIGAKNKGEKSINWKGESITYKALHTWLGRNYGKPKYCEHCGQTDDTKRYCWANKSGDYKRERSDWLRLCCKCHYHYDFGKKGNPNRKLTDDDIKYIKSVDIKRGIRKILANKFNVHYTAIARALKY